MEVEERDKVPSVRSRYSAYMHTPISITRADRSESSAPFANPTISLHIFESRHVKVYPKAQWGNEIL